MDKITARYVNKVSINVDLLIYVRIMCNFLCTFILYLFCVTVVCIYTYQNMFQIRILTTLGLIRNHLIRKSIFVRHRGLSPCVYMEHHSFDQASSQMLQTLGSN